MGAFSAIATGVGALANVTSGIVGGLASSSARKAAAAASARALAEIERLGAPPDLAKEILLEQYELAGILTPEVEKQIDVGISKVAQIQEDAGLRKAQMGALSKMQERAEGGLTAEDRAAMQTALSQAQRSAQARQQQILQQQQARGLGGAGSTLAAQLQAASASAADEAEAALKVGGMASQAALQAATQSGQLAGGIRGQDFDINRARAAAEDQFAMQQFNERVARQTRDVGARNLAQQYNLAQRQKIMDMNAAQRNAELQRQRQAEKDVWGMKLAQAQARANAYTGQAQQLQQQAAATQQGWTQALQGAGGALMAGGQYAQNRQDRQDDRDLAQQNRQEDREFLKRLYGIT